MPRTRKALTPDQVKEQRLLLATAARLAAAELKEAQTLLKSAIKSHAKTQRDNEAALKRAQALVTRKTSASDKAAARLSAFAEAHAV